MVRYWEILRDTSRYWDIGILRSWIDIDRYKDIARYWNIVILEY